VRYVVLGCGPVGVTVAAVLARDGHDVLISDPDPAVVAAVSSAGLRVESPEESFTVTVRAVGWEDLPPTLDGPVLVAVRTGQLTAAAGALARRLQGAGYAICLRHGLDAGILARAVGPQRVAAAYAAFDAIELAPGVVRQGDHTTLLVGELENFDTERIGLLASHLPHAQVTKRITGCLWTGLARDAVLAAASVSDQPLAEVLDDPRYQPLLLALARELLAQAHVPPEPVPPGGFDPADAPGGFDPADLPGSLARLARASLGSPNPHAEAYLDLAVRRRPSEVPALLAGRGGVLAGRLVELVRAIETGPRPCAPGNLALLAAHERLERLGRPLNAACAAIGAPDRAYRTPAGRWPGARSASRTSSRWPACRPATAARPATPVRPPRTRS
jgi:ketopantoate reductase